MARAETKRPPEVPNLPAKKRSKMSPINDQQSAAAHSSALGRAEHAPEVAVHGQRDVRNQATLSDDQAAVSYVSQAAPSLANQSSVSLVLGKAAMARKKRGGGDARGRNPGSIVKQSAIPSRRSRKDAGIGAKTGSCTHARADGSNMDGTDSRVAAASKTHAHSVSAGSLGLSMESSLTWLDSCSEDAERLKRRILQRSDGREVPIQYVFVHVCVLVCVCIIRRQMIHVCKGCGEMILRALGRQRGARLYICVSFVMHVLAMGKGQSGQHCKSRTADRCVCPCNTCLLIEWHTLAFKCI